MVLQQVPSHPKSQRKQQRHLLPVQRNQFLIILLALSLYKQQKYLLLCPESTPIFISKTIFFFIFKFLDSLTSTQPILWFSFFKLLEKNYLLSFREQSVIWRTLASFFVVPSIPHSNTDIRYDPRNSTFMMGIKETSKFCSFILFCSSKVMQQCPGQNNFHLDICIFSLI